MSNQTVYEASVDIPSSTPHNTNFNLVFVPMAQNANTHDLIVDNSNGGVALQVNVNRCEVFEGVARVVESDAPTIDDGACSIVAQIGVLRDQVNIVLQTASDVVTGYTARVRIRSTS